MASYKLISTIQKRPDRVLVTVEDSEQVLDSTTGACRRATVEYNPATGEAHLKKKIEAALAPVESGLDSLLEAKIKTAVEAMNVAKS